jgi:type I restriction enzyme M protein
MTSVRDIDKVLVESSQLLRDSGLPDGDVLNGLLAIFLLKYVCDCDESLQARGRFVVPLPADFRELVKQSALPGNAGRIDAALRALEEANPAHFGGLFAQVRFQTWDAGKHGDHAIAAVLRLFGAGAVDFRPGRTRNDAVGATFEFLLSLHPFNSRLRAGEFYTPRDITRLMTRLVAPEPGESIYDPACGSGGFLLESARFIQQHYSSRDYALYGQEINRNAWMIAKLNAVFHGEDDHHIVLGDTLRKPLLVNGNELQRFDVVVSNPPFSLKDWGWEQARHDAFNRFAYGIPPKTRGDYAFIQHMVASMNTAAGRMAIIVPHGVLFRGGGEDEIRRNLLKDNLLDAVIGLPPKMFYSSAISAVILVFRKTRGDEAVLFIDSSREFLATRKLNSFRDEDIGRLVAVFQQRIEQRGYSRLVSQAEIAANDFNLNMARYLDSSAQRPTFDMNSLAKEAQELNSELETLRREINSALQKISPSG